jgi:hypothetical protein
LHSGIEISERILDYNSLDEAIVAIRMSQGAGAAEQTAEAVSPQILQVEDRRSEEENERLHFALAVRPPLQSVIRNATKPFAAGDKR